MKTVKILIALCIGVASVSFSAQPASADAFSCDSGEYCMYKDAHGSLDTGIYTTAGFLDNYSGEMFRTTFLSPPLNDAVSDYKNNGVNQGPTIVYSYSDKDGGGVELWRAPLGQHPGYVGDNANDKASSHYWFFS